MKRFKASVIGGSGYGGGEMIRRLLVHPQVELVRVASIDHVGESLSNVHPNLEGQTDLVFENLSPRESAEGVDVVLLRASPQGHGRQGAGAARELREDRRALGRLPPDLEGDLQDLLRRGASAPGAPARRHLRLRLARSEPRRHPQSARRGLARLLRDVLELSLLPLARKGLLRGAVETVAITGSSGSGIAPSEGTHHPSRSQNLKTYKPLSHQHVPEIEELLRRNGAADLALRFVPISAPLARGIFSTSFVRVPADVAEDTLRTAFADAYANEPFVRVPKKRLPEVVAVAGSNHVEVGFALGPVEGDTRLVTCFSAIDNLIKGGAGQGIQNMNLLLGLDETLSLADPGGYPGAPQRHPPSARSS